MLSLKIAVGQLCSSSNLSQNLRVVKLLQKAQLEKARLLFYQKQPIIFLETPTIQLSYPRRFKAISYLHCWIMSSL